MEVSKWLDNLSKKYVNDITCDMKEDKAIDKANYILKKLGVYSPEIPKKKVKTKRFSHTSSIVIEPRGNEPKYSIKSKENKSFSEKKQQNFDEKNSVTQLKGDNIIIIGGCQIKNQNDNIKRNLSIEETPNLSISLPVDDLNYSQEKPNRNKKKVNIHKENKNINKISLKNSLYMNKPVQKEALKPKIENRISREKNELKKLNDDEPIRESVKTIHNIPKNEKKNNFKKQIEKYYLIKLLNLFSVWQEKTIIIRRHRFTIETLSKLRTKRIAFHAWRNHFQKREIEHQRYEEEMKNHVYNAKLQRMQHTAKIKLQILRKKIAFDKWFKSMNKPKLAKKRKVNEIPIYKRPPNPLPPKKPPTPVKIDPRAEDLIKRTEESKANKLKEAKQRIAEDIEQKKQKEKEEKEKLRKIRRQRKKELENEHEKRIENAKKEEQAREKFKLMQKQKKEYELMLEKAYLFRRRHLFRNYFKIIDYRRKEEEKSLKNYDRHLCKRVFCALSFVLANKEKELEKIAIKQHEKTLKQNTINKLRKNVIQLKRFIKNTQKKLGIHVVTSCFNEWKSAFIEENRSREFKAIQFHDNRLLKKVFEAWPVIINEVKEGEARQKKRDDLMAKAMQYLNENRFKKTSEFEDCVLKPGHVIIENISDSESMDEEESDYSDMF